jgi:hypothetical protein
MNINQKSPGLWGFFGLPCMQTNPMDKFIENRKNILSPNRIERQCEAKCVSGNGRV